MKNVYSILLCFCLLSLSLGCSAAPKTETTNQMIPASNQPVTLTILHIMDNAHHNALKKVTDSLTRKYPNITFDIQRTNTVQYADLLKTKIASGEAPDIMFGKVSEYTDIVEAGQVLDLTDQPFVNNMRDVVKKLMTVDGKVYGIAEDIFTLGVFYNKDMFKQYGLEVPQTYSEFVNVMETFQKQGMPPFVRGFKDQQWVRLEFLSEWRVIAAQKYPNFFVDIQSGKTSLSDYPEFKDTLARFAKRLSYKSDDEFTLDPDKTVELFAHGKAPMLLFHSGNLTDIRKYNPDGNFGFFAPPISDHPEDNKIIESPDLSFMISSQSKHKEEALKLFAYMLSPEGWKEWNRYVSTLPAIKNVSPENSDPMLDDIIKYQKAGKMVEDVFLFTGEAKKKEFEMYQQFASKPQVNLDEFIRQWSNEFHTLANTNP